jgi:hypothetical protein
MGSMLEEKPRVVEPRSAAAAAAGGKHRIPDRGQVCAQSGHEDVVMEEKPENLRTIETGIIAGGV